MICTCEQILKLSFGLQILEYKKCRQIAKSAISSAKEKKQKECASDLNDSEHQNEIFRKAKQMVKENRI